MKCSLYPTCIKVFLPYLPKGGSRTGWKMFTGVPFFKKLLQTRRQQQQTECITMILKHVIWSVVIFCSIPKSNVWCIHRSQVSDSGPLGLLFIYYCLYCLHHNYFAYIVSMYWLNHSRDANRTNWWFMYNPIEAVLPIWRHTKTVFSLFKICDNTTKVYFISTDNVFLPS